MKHLFLLSVWLMSTISYAQTPSEIENAPALNKLVTDRMKEAGYNAMTARGKKDSTVGVVEPIKPDSRSLLDFYIPSALFTFNVEPASVSRVTLALTNTNFSFKYGRQFGKKGPDGKLIDHKPANGLGIAVSTKLADGAKTLFTPDDVSKEYSVKIIGTLVARDIVYVLTSDTAEYTSHHAQWFNLNLNGDIVQKNVFNNDTSYTKHNNLNLQFLVTFNNLFTSLLDGYKRQRNILTAGLGYGRFDNYESLSKYTLRRSIVSTAGGYLGEKSSVSGRRGDFRRLSGLIGTASVFIPLTSPTELTSLIVGANGTLFGLGTDNYTATVNAGFFLSQRTYKDKKLTENFSFGLLAVFDQLQKRSEANYAQDNFSVILTTQIPISFR